MYITFLRHATAEDRKLDTADADRALTDKGEKQMKRVAGFCKSNELLPAVLYCSPLRRAQQTAWLLEKHLPDCPEPFVADWLNTDTTPELALSQLAALADQGQDEVWLVGHEPTFSLMIAKLLHGGADSVAVKKASLVRLEANFDIQPHATLEWSVPCALMP